MTYRIINIFMLVISICVSNSLLSQSDPTPDKGTGIMYFADGRPGNVINPTDVSGYELAWSIPEQEGYVWDRVAGEWIKWFAIDQTSSAPVADPLTGPKTVIDTTDGKIYWWDGAVWQDLTTGGGAGNQDLFLKADSLDITDGTGVAYTDLADSLNLHGIDTSLWRDMGIWLEPKDGETVRLDGGSESAPAYSFNGDQTTGFYQFSPGTFGVTSLGEYKLLIDDIVTIYRDPTDIPTITVPNFGLYERGGNNRLVFWKNNNADFQIEAWTAGVGYDKNLVLEAIGGSVLIGTETDFGGNYALQLEGGFYNQITTSNDFLITDNLGTDTLVLIDEGGDMYFGDRTWTGGGNEIWFYAPSRGNGGEVIVKASSFSNSDSPALRWEIADDPTRTSAAQMVAGYNAGLLSDYWEMQVGSNQLGLQSGFRLYRRDNFGLDVVIGGDGTFWNENKRKLSVISSWAQDAAISAIASESQTDDIFEVSRNNLDNLMTVTANGQIWNDTLTIPKTGVTNVLWHLNDTIKSTTLQNLADSLDQYLPGGAGLWQVNGLGIEPNAQQQVFIDSLVGIGTTSISFPPGWIGKSINIVDDNALPTLHLEKGSKYGFIGLDGSAMHVRANSRIIHVSVGAEDIEFWPANVEALTLKGNDQNVGIYDANPDYRFEINGTNGLGYFGISNLIDGDILEVNNSGELILAGLADQGAYIFQLEGNQYIRANDNPTLPDLFVQNAALNAHAHVSASAVFTEYWNRSQSANSIWSTNPQSDWSQTGAAGIALPNGAFYGASADGFTTNYGNLSSGTVRIFTANNGTTGGLYVLRRSNPVQDSLMLLTAGSSLHPRVGQLKLHKYDGVTTAKMGAANMTNLAPMLIDTTDGYAYIMNPDSLGGGGSAVNLYNSDGILTSNRTVNMIDKDLVFDASNSGAAQIFVDAQSAAQSVWNFQVNGTTEARVNGRGDWVHDAGASSNNLSFYNAKTNGQIGFHNAADSWALMIDPYNDRVAINSVTASAFLEITDGGNFGPPYFDITDVTSGDILRVTNSGTLILGAYDGTQTGTIATAASFTLSGQLVQNDSTTFANWIGLDQTNGIFSAGNNGKAVPNDFNVLLGSWISFEDVLYINDGSNEVGINETNPGADLHVTKSNSSYSLAAVFENDHPTNGLGIQFLNQGLTRNLWWNGTFGTWNFGGGGGGATNKAIHVHGSMTIGTSEESTDPGLNALYVQGNITTEQDLLLGGITDQGATPLQVQSGQDVAYFKSTTNYVVIDFFGSSSLVEDAILFGSLNATYSIGGGGADVLGKKLHVEGGTSIGTSVDATPTPTNGLYVEGHIRGQSGYQDSSGDLGTSGQLLSSTATGTNWIDAPSGANGLWSASNDGTDIASNMDVGIPTYLNFGTDLLYLNETTGQVGIGAAPDHVFDINSSGTAVANIETGNGGTAQWRLSEDGNIRAGTVYDGTQNKMLFYLNPNELMEWTINSTTVQQLNASQVRWDVANAILDATVTASWAMRASSSTRIDFDIDVGTDFRIEGDGTTLDIGPVISDADVRMTDGLGAITALFANTTNDFLVPNGSIGVGVSSTTATTEIHSSTSIALLHLNNSTTGAGLVGLEIKADGTDVSIVNLEDGELTLGTDAQTNQIRILENLVSINNTGFGWTTVTYSNVSSPHTVPSNMGWALIDTNGGDVEMDLQASTAYASGQWLCFMVTDSSNDLIIDPNGTDTINGSTTSITVSGDICKCVIKTGGGSFTTFSMPR